MSRVIAGKPHSNASAAQVIERYSRAIIITGRCRRSRRLLRWPFAPDANALTLRPLSREARGYIALTASVVNDPSRQRSVQRSSQDNVDVPVAIRSGRVFCRKFPQSSPPSLCGQESGAGCGRKGVSGSAGPCSCSRQRMQMALALCARSYYQPFEDVA
jgi:hypothetical protein